MKAVFGAFFAQTSRKRPSLVTQKGKAMEFEKELKVTKTNIPGLIVFDLPVHGDNRGWFK